MAIGVKAIKPNQGRFNVRTSSDDEKLIVALQKKLGIDPSQIFRLAIRALATKEGVSA